MGLAVRNGAFDDLTKFEVEESMQMCRQSLGQALFGNGSGRICQIAAISASTITVTNAFDLYGLRQNTVLAASTTDGTGAVEAGTLTVASVNFTASQFTVGSTYATGSISTLAVGDYLFRDGDYGSKLQGFAAWLPGKSLTSTAFNGLDRTVAPQFLAGWGFDGSRLSPEEAIQGAVTQMAPLGVAGGQKVVFMSYIDQQNLVRSLNSKVIYTEFKGPRDVFFEGIKIRAGNGYVDVYVDQFCPVGVAYLLDLKSWKLHTVGAAPRFLGEDGIGDGLRFLRDPNLDAYQYRLGYYGNLVCYSPKRNSVIYMPAA
jgi:hypothetical protein